MSVELTEHFLRFLSLKEDCTGSFESTLVKIPHCWKIWKSHVTAHMFSFTEVWCLTCRLTMQASDLEVIKEIPGYKVILKAVLKSQIQHMVRIRVLRPEFFY